MIGLTLVEIAAAVHGELVRSRAGEPLDTLITGQSQTDSREVQPGQIFFARRGETTDGHRFVGAAIDAGAALLIVERPVDDRVPQIVVHDSTDALGALATEVIHRALTNDDLTIVGITGSNGKTTTKNLVSALAARVGNTVASEKSFNNEVGGPLTMLRVTADTRVLVAEMGASARGEIARLTAMAPPHIGVVLSVGLAHAGEFGDIETTFRTKAEMVSGLQRTDTAVLNRDDPFVARMAEDTEAEILWFGRHPDAQVRATEVYSDVTGTRFQLHVGDTVAPVHFRVLGEHHVANALAAAAVASRLGLPLAEIVDVLQSTTRAAKWRMEVLGGRDGVTIINDAYNASPDSMSAALRTLAQIGKPEGRTVAVLGAMSELGEYTIEEHLRIGLQTVRLGISELVVVGNEARDLHVSAVNEGSWDGESVFFAEMDEAQRYLLDTIQPQDTVLVKSSNAAGLRHLGDALGEAFA